MAYNSYLIRDEKIAVMDTVDRRYIDEWLDNLNRELEGRSPDYLVVQHMEPDHSSGIQRFAEAYPEAVIVASQMAFAMMRQFFGTDFSGRQKVVGEKDTLSLGQRTLTFLTAPMVHWPEVIVTYDDVDQTLFSADGFGEGGKFGGMGGEGHQNPFGGRGQGPQGEMPQPPEGGFGEVPPDNAMNAPPQ